MKRIIIEYTPPEANQAGIFHLPQSAIAIQYEGKLYIDYIVDSATESPAGAYYIGEMLADGSVVDTVGNASEFPHVFAGWDRKTPDAELMAAVSITPRQARLILLEHGFLDVVEAMVAQQPESVRIQWEYAIDIKRNDPLVCALLEGMGQTPEQIDTLFMLAKTL